MNEGKISQIIGVAIDVDFPEGELPEIYNAVEVPKPDGTKLVLEVQQHLGEDRVRCISMDSTDGLVRGTQAYDTGNPITVPVGQEVLGRLMNVVGEPIDQLGPIETETRYPIHHSAPELSELATVTEILETGITILPQILENSVLVLLFLR